MRVISTLLAYWAGRGPPRLLPRWKPPDSHDALSLMQVDASQNPSGEQVDGRGADLELNMPLMPFGIEKQQGHHVAESSPTQGRRFRNSVNSADLSVQGNQRHSDAKRQPLTEPGDGQNRDAEKSDNPRAIPDLVPDLENGESSQTGSPSPPSRPSPPPPPEEPHEGHADVGKAHDDEQRIPDLLPDLEGEAPTQPPRVENEKDTAPPSDADEPHEGHHDVEKAHDEEQAIPDLLPDLESPTTEPTPPPEDLEQARDQAIEEERREEVREREERGASSTADREETERLKRIKEEMDKDPDAVRREIKKEIRQEIEEEIREELEEELEKEEKAIKEEVEKDVEDDVQRDVEEEVEEKVKRRVKKELAEEGLGNEERISGIGEQALEDKWFTFMAACLFLVVIGMIIAAVCYFGPGMAGEEEVVEAEPEAPQEPLGFWQGIGFLVLRPVNAMLIFVPVGLGVHFYAHKTGHTLAFWINILAIVPEAYIIGITTEEIALMMGDVVGALWNASFGNVVELILVYLTLREGLITVCEGSIVGAILCNHLLLLGFCFILGGTAIRRTSTDGETKYRFGFELEYDAKNALSQAQQLLVAAFSVTLPSLFADMQNVTLSHVLVLSYAVSCFILVSYAALVTHQLVSMPSKEVGLQSRVSKASAFSVLIATTVMCALSSEALVEAVSGYAIESGYSKSFLGVVVLPIAGDLTHVSAVYMAMKGKMELATSIALSSAIQIAMVVLPLAVFMGYLLDQPMTLNLRAMHSVCLVVSAVVTFAVMVDGKANWLRGYTLLTTFFMIALIVFFQPDLGAA